MPNGSRQRSLRTQQTPAEKNHVWPFDRQKFRPDGDRRQREVEQIFSKLPSLPSQSNSLSEMAESLAKVVLDEVTKKVPPPTRRTHKLGWCEPTETAAAFKVVWDAREDARRSMRIRRDRTSSKTPTTACANLRGVIDAGLHAYLEEYLADTERLLAENGQRGFYKYLKCTIRLGGRKAGSEQSIMDEDDTLLSDKVRISVPSLARNRLNSIQLYQRPIPTTAVSTIAWR